MKKIAVLAVVMCGLSAGACTVRSERTVVERPAQPTTAVVVPDAPPPGTAVVVRDR
jgi:hypothetical protein